VKKKEKKKEKQRMKEKESLKRINRKEREKKEEKQRKNRKTNSSASYHLFFPYQCRYTTSGDGSTFCLFNKKVFFRLGEMKKSQIRH
jgi:hypothetical protein